MSTRSTRLCSLCAALALGSLATPVLAQSAGDWTVGVGVHQVNPKSDNGSLAGNTLDVSVGSDVKPTITAEYFFSDHLGIEVLASWQFEHDISINGVGKVGSTKHLPPTVSLQYHFGQGNIRPFIGAGVNFTLFSNEQTSGVLAGNDLELDDSWGLAAHAGIDFKVGERGAIRLDARWIDIDTDVKLNGADIGTVEIDPLVYGIAYVYSF